MNQESKIKIKATVAINNLYSINYKDEELEQLIFKVNEGQLVENEYYFWEDNTNEYDSIQWNIKFSIYTYKNKRLISNNNTFKTQPKTLQHSSLKKNLTTGTEITLTLIKVNKYYLEILDKLEPQFDAIDYSLNKELENILENLNEIEKPNSQGYYSFINEFFRGVCYFLLVRYKKSIKHFEIAKKLWPIKEGKYKIQEFIDLLNSRLRLKNTKNILILSSPITTDASEVESIYILNSTMKGLQNNLSNTKLNFIEVYKKNNIKEVLVELTCKNYDIIIFIGHGNIDGFKFFFPKQKKTNKTKTLQPKTLELITSTNRICRNSKAKGVVLLGCLGDFYLNSAKSNYKLIYTADTLNFQLAEVFAAGFITGLNETGDFERAFEIGRLALSIRMSNFYIIKKG